MKIFNKKVTKQGIRFAIASFFLASIGLGVYWFFADTLHIKALTVSLFYYPVILVVKFIIYKLWVYKDEE